MEYLIFRHGFSASDEPTVEEELKSIVNFYNFCVAVDAKMVHLADLPTTWDLGCCTSVQRGG
jgi:hypothetical protein